MYAMHDLMLYLQQAVDASQHNTTDFTWSITTVLQQFVDYSNSADSVRSQCMKSRASATKNASSYAGNTNFTCWKMTIERSLDENEMDNKYKSRIYAKHALKRIEAEFLGAWEE